MNGGRIVEKADDRIQDIVEESVEELIDEAGDENAFEQASSEELDMLRAEAEKTYQKVLEVYKTRFTELPSVRRLKERWKTRGIADDDPMIMGLEVHALGDARNQIAHVEMMNVIQAFEKMTRIYARQVRLSASETATSRKETAAFMVELAKTRSGHEALTRSIGEYGREVPELLEIMAGTRRLCDSASKRSKVELMAIGAAFLLLGILIGKLLLGR